MELTIRGKKYQFVFGVGFVRELDKAHGLSDKEGVSFGMALTRVLPSLEMYDAAVLSDVLKCAAQPAISQDDLDAYIDNPKTDIEQLFNKVNKEINSANAIKLAAKKLREG